MTPQIKKRLEEIEKRDKTATSGPWRWLASDHYDGMWLRDRTWRRGMAGGGPKLGFNHHPDEDPIISAEADADYEFISHSRQDIPLLLAIAREAITALEKVNKAAGHGSVGACRMWANEALANIEKLAGEK